MGQKHDLLVELLEPVVKSMGCELWGLEYFAQGRHSTVRLYIDREQGVSLEDCEKVSRQVSSVMDVEDPISGEYTLEVSSPGMDRPLYSLEQYRRYVGEQLSVRLSSAHEGRRKFQGQLKEIGDEQVLIEVDGQDVWWPFHLIDKANIVPRF